MKLLLTQFNSNQILEELKKSWAYNCRTRKANSTDTFEQTIEKNT